MDFTPLLAGLAMFVKDSLDALIVQAEARNRGWIAGGLDMVKWLAEITTTTISVVTLAGHDSLWIKGAVILFVSAGNLTGRVVGVAVGKRLIKEVQDEWW